MEKTAKIALVVIMIVYVLSWIAGAASYIWCKKAVKVLSKPVNYENIPITGEEVDESDMEYYG